jgi:hypothetical protein
MPTKPATVEPVESNLTDPFSAVLARAGVRDRTNLARQLSTAETEPTGDRAALWRRLVGTLGTLAPLAATTQGPSIAMFQRPDGKYRMQVFSLEVAEGGLLYVYLPDVLDLAESRHLLKRNAHGGYAIVGKKTDLPVTTIDGSASNPPAHVKHLVGWKRKAIRIALDASDVTTPRVAATESLCALAAESWAQPTTTK